MFTTARFPLICILAAALSGCTATTADYPTLELRDFERNPAAYGAPPPASAPPASLTPAQTSQIAGIESRAQSAHRAFIEAAPSARRAVQRGARAPIGSDAAGDALVALADLEAKRSLTAIALADLDLFYASAATALQSNDEIGEARQRVTALVQAEDAVLAQLRDTVRR
ncbi:hypothetical protein [Pontixanthobacter sp.]|uniref:hypothetical protein n=1 Tax=Pontixanthobacter sp. TaxID=2792078 RepID=UPI003C7CE2EC